MIRPNTDTRARVLILEPDRILQATLSQWLRHDGYEVQTADALSDTAIGEDRFDLILVDLDNAGRAPAAALAEVRRHHPSAAVVVLSRYGSVDGAKEATRGGAVDYLVKPLAADVLCAAVDRAVRQQALMADDRTLRQRLDRHDGIADIIGNDMKMQRVFDVVDAVADSRTNVLILGESGTGKSMLARAIHARSPRRERSFVEVACGSLPDTLLESELFGHVKGGFTGALADKPGRFVTADGGTIFLDEINSAPPAMQVKLLRVLQERRLEPVGSDATRQVDVAPSSPATPTWPPWWPRAHSDRTCFTASTSSRSTFRRSATGRATFRCWPRRFLPTTPTKPSDASSASRRRRYAD